ncbi:MAG: PD-(D/E)XK nuclease family protein, partial [Pacificimonas sp.]
GDWLGHVRRLDLALRGVRPARGLQGVRNRLSSAVKSKRQPSTVADLDWWKALEPVLRPMAELFQRRATGDLAAAAEKLRTLVANLAGDRFWDGNAGRAASDLLSSLERHGDVGGAVSAPDLPAVLGAVMDDVPVRPSYGRHPRLNIYGLLEARLQRADLMILGGLNEGVWPAGDRFDPWLPPRVRAALNLPPIDRATALSAHDFVQACGAGEVLLTRARRDASAPVVASRFWLRMGALLGDRLVGDARLKAWTAAMDRPAKVTPAKRPRPKPPASDRPKRISVTEVEVLRADPYQFWAKRMLRLGSLDALGEEADAAARGTIVHDLMETLSKGKALADPDARIAAIDAALKAYSDHPLLSAMWRPRVERMLTWAADQMALQQAKGWRIAGVETEGKMMVDGVELRGKADVVFQHGERLAVADYKTGAPPAVAKIRAGYSDQLALLAWLATEEKFDGISGKMAAVAYWRLSGGGMEGEIKSSSSVTKAHPWSELDVWLKDAQDRFRAAAARWLTGDEAFTARLHPEYAPKAYNSYDHLARVAEWEGRVRGDD